MVKHTRQVYNILDLLSKFGGLAGIIFKVFAVLGRNFNERLLFSKFIRSLYFKKNQNHKESKNKIELCHFKLMDHLPSLKRTLQRLFCLKVNPKSYNQKVFDAGKYNVEKDLSVVQLVYTIRKLKAGLSAIIKNDENLMKEAKRIYL